MGKTATNIAVVLGLITVAYAGYYVYTSQVSGDLSSETDTQTMQNMLNNTKVFVSRREVLSTIKMNTSLFEDPRFTSLHKFSTNVLERNVGRPDPFLESEVISTGNY